ncbi:hypothetical protein V8G54_021400 [Vigna mungo]|uniref:Uncharacterized protein n=1 Tax=Vigna mungo TaxID=3915 RepID=A0AAQ3NDE5_VIGMU
MASTNLPKNEPLLLRSCSTTVTTLGASLHYTSPCNKCSVKFLYISTQVQFTITISSNFYDCYLKVIPFSSSFHYLAFNVSKHTRPITPSFKTYFIYIYIYIYIHSTILLLFFLFLPH